MFIHGDNLDALKSRQAVATGRLRSSSLDRSQGRSGGGGPALANAIASHGRGSPSGENSAYALNNRAQNPNGSLQTCPRLTMQQPL
jgi:hypothetical protein